MNRLRHLPFLVAAAALASACSSPSSTVRAEGATSRVVSVDRVTRQDLGRTLELPAEFRPYEEVDLHAKVAGYLRAIYVDVGDHVTQGQRIADLEAPEMMQEAAQADAALKRAQVDVERARADLKRAEAQEHIRKVAFDRISAVVKVRPNLVAQQDVDDSNDRLQEADAELAASKAAVAAAEEQVSVATAAKERDDTLLTYLHIVAPFGGVITKRLADPGAMIQAGTASSVQAMPVVQLSQVDRLRMVLPVPESVVPSINLKAPVEVRVDALKRVFQGRISRYTGKLDTATRTMWTEVDLPNPGNVIKAGMFGNATLTLEHRHEVLSIPVQALAGRSAPITVFVVGRDQTLKEQQIKIGLETPDRVEVTSGLKEGDLVVVGARGDLKAGLRVTPKVQSASTATGTY
jgi:RND family efflux transporter MFP subunit